MFMVLQPPPLIEVAPVQDVFAYGLGDVEAVGAGCFRFTLYSRRNIDGQLRGVIVARFILPTESVPPAIYLAAKTIGFSLASGHYFPSDSLH